jgi:hypothetical protein
MLRDNATPAAQPRFLRRNVAKNAAISAAGLATTIFSCCYAEKRFRSSVLGRFDAYISLDISSPPVFAATRAAATSAIKATLFWIRSASL